MTHTLIFIQSVADTTAAMQKYADKWNPNLEQAEHSGYIMQTLASNNLIFVVLCVTLIIWFILLFFIIRTDRKVSKLEETLINQEKKQEDET